MEQNVSIAIVTIAYNRPDSLKRLLDSLDNVNYEGHNVPLYISVDYSGDDSVYKVADAFEWKFGEKKVIKHAANLGLKKHVLACGDLVEDYDALIVLEDDLVVSPAMYSFTFRAVEKYKNDDNIIAVSLYTKGFSETACKPFDPALSNSDTYFIQTAESWGQVWLKDQWLLFKQWYSNHTELSDSESIPPNVRQWDEKSWKKYHIWYTIENNKYTVYPYTALANVNGAEGEHVVNNEEFNLISWIEVPLQKNNCKEYRFIDFDDEHSVKYDAFLERVYQDKSDTCMDLYGLKTDYSSYRYVITPKHLDYKIVETFGLLLRPHEENIAMSEKGEYFYKYDLSVRQKNPVKNHSEMKLRYYHYIDYIGVTNDMMVIEIIKQLFRVIKKRITKRLCRKKS